MEHATPLLTLAAFSDLNPFWMMIFGFLGLWVILATVDSMHKTSQRERTAREIAAYVAEGSISAADAGHLMESQQRAKLRERLTELVAEQWLDAETAEKIMGDGFSVTVRASDVRTARRGPDATPANA